MTDFRFTVEAAEAGARLDQLVASRAPELSRARARQLIDEGDVLLDGKPAKGAQRVRAGSEIVIAVPAPKPVALVAQDLKLRPLFEDKHLLVLDKPAGIAVHPGAGGGGATLVHGLLHHVADLRGIGGELRPGIVHRLDKDTSGCLVVAKSEAALHGLQAAFKSREVEKRYLALAHGQLDDAGELDTLYGRHPVERKRFSSKVESGKRAVTRWRVLARAAGAQVGGSGASAIEVDLLTGRTHQIRAHFSDAGHPLLADSLYGGSKREGRLEDSARLKQAALAVGRQALHAWVLEFQHPITRKRIACTAPIPPELAGAFALLGIDADALANEAQALRGADDDVLRAAPGAGKRAIASSARGAEEVSQHDARALEKKSGDRSGRKRSDGTRR